MTANPASQPGFRQHASPAAFPLRSDEGQFRLITLINILLKRRFAILAFALVAAAAAAIISLITPPVYTARASFLPQGGQSNSTMSGLAAQLGLDVGNPNQGASPAFYADLAQTRQILGAVVEAHYRIRDGGREVVGTLPTFFHSAGSDSAHRRDEAIRQLDRTMDVSFDARTSTVTVLVKSANPDLSRQIVDTLLAAVSQFNLERRQSQASAERKFTEARLAEVRTDLRRAEDELQFFLQRNRILGSAELEAQRERLTREVSLQQQVYATLAQAYERAKLEEVRDTPVITVVESPETPLKPDSRHLITKTVLMFLIGLFLGSLIAVMRERLAMQHDVAQDEWSEFAHLKQLAFQDIKHPMRAVRRMVTRPRRASRESEVAMTEASGR